MDRDAHDYNGKIMSKLDLRSLNLIWLGLLFLTFDAGCFGLKESRISC